MKKLSGRFCQGFTLIEVTLGLAILILIFGVIFQLVQMSVLGAEAAGKNSLRSRELSGLFALMRQLCLDLPVRSQLLLELRPEGRGYDLVLSNAPVAILPGNAGGTRSLRLALRRDLIAGGNLLLLQEVLETTNEMTKVTSSQTNTFELMRDIVALTWWGGDPRNREQMDQREWSDPVKPAYLKMELVRRDAGRNLTNTGIFWIPSGYGPGGQPPVDPVTRLPLTLTNPASS